MVIYPAYPDGNAVFFIAHFFLLNIDHETNLSGENSGLFDLDQVTATQHMTE